MNKNSSIIIMFLSMSNFKLLIFIWLDDEESKFLLAKFYRLNNAANEFWSTWRIV